MRVSILDLFDEETSKKAGGDFSGKIEYKHEIQQLNDRLKELQDKYIVLQEKYIRLLEELQTGKRRK